MILVIQGSQPVQDLRVTLQDGKECILMIAGKVKLAPMENCTRCFQYTEKPCNSAVREGGE
jgi:hypothetical protein